MSSGSSTGRYEPIENHGVIGNMRSAAMVSLDGTIDFFCFPRFDSPTVFSSLLDSEKGGCFQVIPDLPDRRLKQLYLPDTNILLTRYLSEDGVAELIDFMPVEEGLAMPAYAHQIIRMLRVIRGSVRFQIRCAPSFDYGRAVHRTCKEGEAICFRPEGVNLPAMALVATVPLDTHEGVGTADFVLHKGETASFAFGSLRPEEKAPTQKLDAAEIEERFRQSHQFWRSWLANSTYKGRWREMVDRSALALKLLFSQGDGATVAAATFGLPEHIGGSRNWDYRYTWLRDSSFCLYALVRLGFSGEVQSYTQWLRTRLRDGLNTPSEDGPLRVMYRADGSDHLDETELALDGFDGSRPVRVGNRAAEQFQLDIYVEIMDAVYLSNKYSSGMSKEGWRNVIRLLEWLEKSWKRPDQGIWEVRGERKELLHSRLMSWVAFDRAIRLAHKRSLDAPLADWYETRRQIDADIVENFWDEELNSYVQAKGEKRVDAALLLMPMLRYISPTDVRWTGTMDRIEKELAEDSLVLRYASRVDGIDEEEGYFTACSFWFIECLARSGQVEKALLLFNKMLGYANHLGLYSEQLGRSGQHLGNFPQALTHLALISAATYLNRKLDGVRGPSA